MKANKNKDTGAAARAGERIVASGGFSVVELIIVLVVIAVLSAISLPYIANYKRLYKSEDQALKIMDGMRMASQIALTRRRLIRFEIDVTTTPNEMLIIDGRGPGAADDIEIQRMPLELARDIRVDQIPVGVNRPNPPNYADAAFVTDTIGHLRGTTRISGDRVWQIGFLSNGSAVNAATNVPVSANLYVWSPLTPGSTSARSLAEVRAITIFGGSGAVRYWKYNGSAFAPY